MLSVYSFRAHYPGIRETTMYLQLAYGGRRLLRILLAIDGSFSRTKSSKFASFFFIFNIPALHSFAGIRTNRTAAYFFHHDRAIKYFFFKYEYKSCRFSSPDPAPIPAISLEPPIAGW